MPIKQLMLPSPACNAVMPHNQEVPNHLMHGLLTLFTSGLWLFVWIGKAARGGAGTATCVRCGGVRNTDGTAIQPRAARTGAMGWLDRQSEAKLAMFGALAILLILGGIVAIVMLKTDKSYAVKQPEIPRVIET